MSYRLGSGLFVLPCLLALTCSPAHAGFYQTFEIGPDIYYYQYTEPHLDHLKGVFYGVDAAYTAGYGKLSLTLDFRGAGGSLNYTSNGSGSNSGEGNYVLEPRLLLGREFDPAPLVSIKPYVGFGFRYLFDAGAGIVTNAGFDGYDRASHYYYIPLGVDAGYQIAPAWRVIPNFEYDFLIVGQQSTYLTTIPGYSNDLYNTQHHGMGLRASLNLDGETPIGEIKFGPYFRYWNIGASNMKPVYFEGTFIGDGYEPANHTVEIGASLVYKFK